MCHYSVCMEEWRGRVHGGVVWARTWMASVGPGRVVQDDDTGQVGVDHGEVFNIAPEVQRTVLPKGHTGTKLDAMRCIQMCIRGTNV